MSTGILVLIGIVLLFGVLAFFTSKNSKKVVTPTYQEESKPRLSFDPSIGTPEVTPVAPVPVNDFCFSFDATVATSTDSICDSQDFLTVYSSNEIFSGSQQFYTSEEACKFDRPNWPNHYTCVKFGEDYFVVDSNGKPLGFSKC